MTRSPRNLAVCSLLALLAITALALAAAWPAAGHPAVPAGTAAAPAPAASCLIHSLPSFVAQGETLRSEIEAAQPQNSNGTAATVGDVIEVECNPYVYGTGAEVTIIASQLYSRCHEISWYVPNEYGAFREARGSSVSLHLDVNGNANVGLIAGPNCMVGESLITLDQNEPPYETFTTSFQVLPSVDTPEGVSALPAEQVEDAQSSGVVTLVEAEFSHATEKHVRLASHQLYSRCQHGKKLIWVRMNRELVVGPELVGEHAIQLDNNGNGFALAVGSDSCAPGPSLIEADLEESPFTTLTTTFTVLSPQPTAEPAFEIEKRQQIDGSGTGFTTSPLTGAVGQTVDYEIIVTNTSAVPETFSGFTDAHCDAGTIGGGPGHEAVGPGGSTVYTCSHLLTTGGTYLNAATVTGGTVGGFPLERTSNQVEVNTPTPAPKLSVEKLQRIADSGGEYTTALLSGLVTQTVEYEIIVKNTGNVPLTLSNFTDSRCDPGTIAGGPGGSPLAAGASTTYTCSHLLASAGTLVNVATVTGTPGGESPITESSPPVEVQVIQGAPSMTIEKLQRIGGKGAYTTSQLTAAVGETVEYEIIVKNTGNVPLTLSNFTDTHCDAGTIAGGPGAAQVATGASVTYTCTHLLTSGPNLVNVALVTGESPTGEKITPQSPPVEVLVPGKANPKPGETPKQEVLGKCEASPPTLRGFSGPERGVFTARVSAGGVKQIIFYLDGRKLRTMKQAQAKHGAFSVKLDARKLRYGAHRVSIKVTMINPACGATAASRAFVRPKQIVAPHFTG